MQKRSSLFTIVFILIIGQNSYGQETPIHRNLFLNGILVTGSIGRFAVKDEYISKEKYSGTLPTYSLAWSRFHEKYGFRVSLEYGHSSNIKNYNVFAEITQFSLNLDYLYPIGKFKLFSKNVYNYFGPSSELFTHYRRQNIASGSADVNSVASLISLGIIYETIFPLLDNLQIETSAQMSLISVGIKDVDTQNTDASNIKFLHPFSGTNSHIAVGFRYAFCKPLTIRIGYLFQLIRISSWDLLLVSSDNLTVAVIVQF